MVALSASISPVSVALRERLNDASFSFSCPMLNVLLSQSFWVNDTGRVRTELSPCFRNAAATASLLTA